MAFLVSQAYDYLHLTRVIRGFVQGHPIVKKTSPLLPFDGITFTGTGAGELYVTTNSGAVAGSSPGTAYRLTCTLGGGAGVATFSFKRDPAGANANVGGGTVTADTRFADSTFGEVIVRTTTNWVIGDQINWSLVNSPLTAEKWIEDRWNENVDSGDGFGNKYTEWVAHGPSVGGGKTIYAGMSDSFDQVADRWNKVVYGMDGYVGGSNIFSQPNGFTQPPLLLLRKTSPMPVWLVCDGDRWAGVVKAAGVYEWFYAGWINIFGTPGNHPMPTLYGGMATLGTEVTSSTGTNHRAFWDGGGVGGVVAACAFRWVDGTWIRPANYDTGGSNTGAHPACFSPYSGNAAGNPSGAISNILGLMQRVLPTIGDSKYELLPITLCLTSPQPAVVGELKGVRAVSGFSQASENQIIDGSDTYIVFQNGFRSGRADFAALKME